MCWICDHPGSSRGDYLDYMRELMACCGWAVQGVEREGVHPPWAYTVGLAPLGQPELVVTGMPLRPATRLLNTLAERMLGSELPPPGEPLTLDGGTMIQIVEVAEPTAHLNIAVEMFGSQITAQQVVHADDRGRWPWQPGYRGVRGGQPVLGPRPVAPVAQPAGTSTAPVNADVPASGTAPADPVTTSDARDTRPDAMGKPSQPGRAPRRRVPEQRTVATRRPGRESGRRRTSRGSRRRSNRPDSRRSSRPR